jgi:hypothetical protein
MTRPEWAELAQYQAGMALLQADPMTGWEKPDAGLSRASRYLTADANLRWAIWCVESLYELRDLVDLDDARGGNLTPLGHRAASVAMGHVMWACVTAMGAFDRVAAAFGALHLPPRDDGRAFDFGELYGRRSRIKHCEPVRQWLRDVKTDAAYADILSLLRNPMTHRTTSMAYYASAGASTPASWRDRLPHQDAPGFYIGDGYRRAIGVDELLEEVTPAAEHHVRRAIEIVTDGTALPWISPFISPA